MKETLKKIFGFLSVLVVLTSCSRFLDEKSDSQLATPQTLEDNQALLDRITDVLGDFASSGMTSSDEFYLSDSDYNEIGRAHV